MQYNFKKERNNRFLSVEQKFAHPFMVILRKMERSSFLNEPGIFFLWFVRIKLEKKDFSDRYVEFINGTTVKYLFSESPVTGV